MNYWMSFKDNKNMEISSLSDITFPGRPLDISELKDRFNRDFVKGSATTVRITFMDGRITKSFIAGFRDKTIVIIDMESRKEYTPKEFSMELNILDSVLKPKLTIKSML